MLRNFLIQNIRKEDLQKTFSLRLWKIKNPYDKNRRYVICINRKPKWFITSHFRKRMKERKISFFEIYKTITFGDSIYGTCSYKKNLVSIFYEKKTRLIIVMTGNKEILITCFRAKDEESFSKKIEEYKKFSSFHERKLKTQKTIWKDEADFSLSQLIGITL